jgi:hypothetical protein
MADDDDDASGVSCSRRRRAPVLFCAPSKPARRSILTLNRSPLQTNTHRFQPLGPLVPPDSVDLPSQSQPSNQDAPTAAVAVAVAPPAHSGAGAAATDHHGLQSTDPDPQQQSRCALFCWCHHSCCRRRLGFLFHSTHLTWSTSPIPSPSTHTSRSSPAAGGLEGMAVGEGAAAGGGRGALFRYEIICVRGIEGLA